MPFLKISIYKENDSAAESIGLRKMYRNPEPFIKSVFKTACRETKGTLPKEQVKRYEVELNHCQQQFNQQKRVEE